MHFNLARTHLDFLYIHREKVESVRVRKVRIHIDIDSKDLLMFAEFTVPFHFNANITCTSASL